MTNKEEKVIVEVMLMYIYLEEKYQNSHVKFVVVFYLKCIIVTMINH